MDDHELAESLAHIRGLASTLRARGDLEQAGFYDLQAILLARGDLAGFQAAQEARWEALKGQVDPASVQALAGRQGASDRLWAETLRYDQLKPEKVSWLWPQRLPKGKLVLLDGDPDVGKSTLAVDLAARFTTGSPLPDGFRPEGPAEVLMLRGEDSAADTVLPRLLAGGGDPHKFTELVAVPRLTDEGKVTYELPEIPGDIAALEAVILRDSIRLVLVDVLMVFLSEKVNAYRDQHVRRALSPLAAMAEATHCCVVCLRHLNKQPSAPALYRGGGSIGLIGAARVGLVAGHDPDNAGRRLLAVAKSNLAPKAETMAYRIVTHDLYGCGHIQWDGISPRSAADVLHMAATEGDDRARLDEAIAVLLEILAEGPQPARNVLAQASQAGVTEPMLRRAKDAAGVTIHKERKQGGRWMWTPPDPGSLLE